MGIVKRLGRIIAIAVLAVIAVGGGLRLTGAVRYLVTSGVSMTPLYHSGDLVVVVPSSHYRVGQIAAYHSELLNTTVLHRIVSISNGKYTFKGDHNPWEDPEHPAASQLLGRAWLHVPHGGVLLALHGAPLILLAAAAILALALTGGGAISSAPRPRRPRRAGYSLHRRVTAGLVATETVFGACLAISLLSGTSPPKPRQLPTVESSTFRYTAQVAPDPVYPTGQVQTGDPVFVRVVPRIEITYDYQASGAVAPLLRGTTQLVLNLSSSNGWHIQQPLGPTVAVASGHAETTATLDLDGIESTLARVRSLTGVDTGTVNVTVDADTTITGGANVSDQFTVPMTMQLTPDQLSAESSPSGAFGGQPAVTTSRYLHGAPLPGPTAVPRISQLLREARLPIIGVIVIVAFGLLLHFYPTEPSSAKRHAN